MCRLAMQQGKFKFHPKCKLIHLIHRIFVDDLLIFTKGNVNVVKEVTNILHLFREPFGRRANHTKYCIYSCGTNVEKKQAIL